MCLYILKLDPMCSIFSRDLLTFSSLLPDTRTSLTDHALAYGAGSNIVQHIARLALAARVGVLVAHKIVVRVCTVPTPCIEWKM